MGDEEGYEREEGPVERFTSGSPDLGGESLWERLRDHLWERSSGHSPPVRHSPHLHPHSILWVIYRWCDRTPGRKHSMHAVTVESEANAHQLARKLNMNHHTTPAGDEYLMRAEVVW